jgi:hypothetical protein
MRYSGPATSPCSRHGFWRERFGGDPNVVGQTMIVNGHTVTIVGVTPEKFRGTVAGSNPDVFLPLSMRTVFTSWRGDVMENRRAYWIYLFGRLRPGSSLAQAEAGLNAVYKPIVSEVEAPLQLGMSDATMRRFKSKSLALAAGRRGQSSMHGEATPRC